MHPVIRIVTCVSFIITITSASLPVIGVLFVSMLGLMLAIERSALAKSFRIIKKLKWLFLSIIILCIWWTPGEPLTIVGYSSESSWWPSEQGILLALQRVGILVLIISSVQLLLIRTVVAELVAAIDWLIAPLAYIGIARQKFAMRCALTLKELQHVENTVTESMKEVNKTGAFRRIVTLLSNVYEQTAYGSGEIENALEIKQIGRPDYIQWLLPIVVLLLPVLINMLLARI